MTRIVDKYSKVWKQHWYTISLITEGFHKYKIKSLVHLYNPPYHFSIIPTSILILIISRLEFHLFNWTLRFHPGYIITSGLCTFSYRLFVS